MKPLFLGYDGKKRPIRLTPEERKIHMHVIGSSGSGKSRLLEWMMRGDLKNRQGFCLIDPHGELYDAVVAYSARHVLDHWDDMLPKFARIMPKDFKRAVASLKRAHEQGLSGEEAIMVAFEENARDLARVGGN